MEKDNSVKFGSTKCDYCGKPATHVHGIDVHIVLCDTCCELMDRPTKRASDHTPLKAAPVYLIDKHKK